MARPKRSATVVSDAERQVLHALWKAGPSPIRPLLDELAASGTQWAYTTLHTLLGRLVAKKLVAVDRDSPSHVYRATVSRTTILGAGLRDLSVRWCDGSARPLLVHLLDQEEFSAKDIEILREMIASKKSKRRRK